MCDQNDVPPYQQHFDEILNRDDYYTQWQCFHRKNQVVTDSDQVNNNGYSLLNEFNFNNEALDSIDGQEGVSWTAQLPLDTQSHATVLAPIGQQQNTNFCFYGDYTFTCGGKIDSDCVSNFAPINQFIVDNTQCFELVDFDSIDCKEEENCQAHQSSESTQSHATVLAPIGQQHNTNYDDMTDINQCIENEDMKIMPCHTPPLIEFNNAAMVN